jgi:hypothetical protein
LLLSTTKLYSIQSPENSRAPFCLTTTLSHPSASLLQFHDQTPQIICEDLDNDNDNNNMALAVANLEHLRLAINELKVGQEPPKDFPRRPEVLIDHAIIPDDEDKQDVELEDLANLLTPYDVVNWKLWSKHFWPNKQKPLLDSLRVPSFAIINIEDEGSCKAATQLRQYEKAF